MEQNLGKYLGRYFVEHKYVHNIHSFLIFKRSIRDIVKKLRTLIKTSSFFKKLLIIVNRIKFMKAITTELFAARTEMLFF